MTQSRHDAARGSSAKVQRGEILRLLHEQGSMTGATILSFFEDFYHRDIVYDEVVASLRYLRDRGYVKFTEGRRDRERRSLPRIEDATITADGVDVIERRKEDAGVDVG